MMQRRNFIKNTILATSTLSLPLSGKDFFTGSSAVTTLVDADEYNSIPITPDAFCMSDHTTLWWLGGGGFMMNSRGTVVLIDPVVSTQPDNPGRCEIGIELVVKYPIDATGIKRVDMILYTHRDSDHLGPITAPALAKRLRPVTVGPPPVFEKLIRLGINHEELISCRPGDDLTAGNVSIEVIDADHPYQLADPFWDHNFKARPTRSGDCCGYILRTVDGSFLFTGDTRLMEHHLRLKNIDVVALDVSRCQFHLNTTGAGALANSLSEAILIPYHYGTYNSTIASYTGSPADVIPRVHNPARARIIVPGQPFSMKDRKEITSGE